VGVGCVAWQREHRAICWYPVQHPYIILGSNSNNIMIFMIYMMIYDDDTDVDGRIYVGVGCVAWQREHGAIC
jgi:hypothetical protein